MNKYIFEDFINCKLSTDEILKNIESLSDKDDFLKYLYSLLFSTDIRVESKRDLNKIISSYFCYTIGKIVTVEYE